jgi:hypothetical protein
MSITAGVQKAEPAWERNPARAVPAGIHAPPYLWLNFALQRLLECRYLLTVATFGMKPITLAGVKLVTGGAAIRLDTGTGVAACTG